MSSTVFIVDDDPSVLTALSRFLTAAGYRVRAFASPQDFLAEHDPELPGCAVIDVSMPGLNGLELQAALKSAEGIARPIVFITGIGDVATSVRAMKQGAVDFLTKPIDETALIAAIDTATLRDAASRRSHYETQDVVKRYGLLTAREKEVFSHVVAGKLNKQIAADLGVAEKTIKLHRGRVMAKMKARSLAELVRLGGQIGLPLPSGR